MDATLAYSRANAELRFAEGHRESNMNHRAKNSGRGGNDLQGEPSFSRVPKSILVPLTLSSGSCAALAIARNLALESNARLTLLHVVNLNIAGEERGIHRARLINELCRNAELQLGELAVGMGGLVNAEVLVCEGRPADAIIETAKSLKADTIVMHTRGHRGWTKWLRENIALKVVRHAPCGVLLVSPAKYGNTLNLVFVDHTTINQQSERLAHHENPNPFRSIVRVLFS